MSKSFQGFVLKKSSYLENDLIITIFSKEISKFNAIGLNAKKSKKRNLNLLDYFNYLKFYIHSKKKYPIAIIERVDLLESFSPEFLKPEHIFFIQILNEIINLLVYGTEENKHLFNLYRETLGKIKKSKNINYFHEIAMFKLKSLKATGLELNPEKCLMCGKSGLFFNYSIEKMGFVCNNCSKNTLKIQAGTIKAIKNLENKNVILTRNIIKDVNKIFCINIFHLRGKEKLKKIIKLENSFNGI